ncbi:MAG: hypothetical protein ACR2MG_01890 [Pyrinomonadaceae bacterium]
MDSEYLITGSAGILSAMNAKAFKVFSCFRTTGGQDARAPGETIVLKSTY